MQVLLENKFLKAEFDVAQSYLYINWFPATEDMTYQEYKNVFHEIAEIVEANRVKYWLGNLVDFRFVVLPELQTWIVERINPKFVEAGLKKMAITVPRDFFSEIALSQSVDEINESNAEQANSFKIQYFENEEGAKNWLLA